MVLEYFISTYYILLSHIYFPSRKFDILFCHEFSNWTFPFPPLFSYVLPWLCLIHSRLFVFLHVYFSRSFAPSPPLVSVTFLLHHPRACAWYCPVLWWEGPSLGVKLMSLSASPTLTTDLPCLDLCPLGWLVRGKGGDQAPS